MISSGDAAQDLFSNYLLENASKVGHNGEMNWFCMDSTGRYFPPLAVPMTIELDDASANGDYYLYDQ